MYENMNRNAAPNANMSYARPQRKKRYAPGRRDVKVSADIDDLAIELSDGARVTGSVTFEGGKPPEYSTLFLAPGEQRPGERVMQATPGAPVINGAFQVEGLESGKYYLHPRAFGPDVGTATTSFTSSRSTGTGATSRASRSKSARGRASRACASSTRAARRGCACASPRKPTRSLPAARSSSSSPRTRRAGRSTGITSNATPTTRAPARSQAPPATTRSSRSRRG